MTIYYSTLARIAGCQSVSAFRNRTLSLVLRSTRAATVSAFLQLAQLLTLGLTLAFTSALLSSGVASAEEIQLRALTDIPLADIRKLYSEKAEYKILRKGKRVGTHTVQITPDPSGDNNKFTVSVDSKIRITVMKVPVFSFRYKATEVWNNNQLVSIKATTVKNGETKEVSATVAGDTMKTVISGGPDPDYESEQSVEPVSFVSNHWHPGVLNSNRIYNTLTGFVDKVSIENPGTDPITIKGSEGNSDTQHSAIHVRYTGGFEAESWYGRDGRWLQLLFKGTDGSLITYQYISPN